MLRKIQPKFFKKYVKKVTVVAMKLMIRKMTIIGSPTDGDDDDDNNDEIDDEVCNCKTCLIVAKCVTAAKWGP